MPASSMTGARKWRFIEGLNVVGIEDTDFLVDYKAEARDDGQAVLGVALRSVWEHSDWTSAPGLARRFYIEERFRVLTLNFVGKKGTLDIDYDTPRAKQFTGIVLKTVDPQKKDDNNLIIYDVGFEYPVTSNGIEIARDLQFSTKNFTAQNYFVEYGREAQTVFKPVFRAASIRVPGGPGLKIIHITAVKRSVSGASALAKRQAAEAEVKDWAWNWTDQQGELKIDGTSLGTCHCRSVSPSDLTLPDAVVYELEFVTSYGS